MANWIAERERRVRGLGLELRDSRGDFWEYRCLDCGEEWVHREAPDWWCCPNRCNAGVPAEAVKAAEE